MERQIRLIHLRVGLLMPRFSVFLLLGTIFSAQAETRVMVDTSMGKFTIEVNAEQSPITVQNFLSYVDAGSYDGTIFHRVISGFMIQGGGYTEKLEETYEGNPIENEAANGFKNLTGTLAMAREAEIDSARKQFFINVDDNAHLDHSDASCTREIEASVAKAEARGLRKPVSCTTYGYAVFGKVIEGMDVVSDIEFVETEITDYFEALPLIHVVIKSMRRQ